MPLMNFRVDDETKARIHREATSVPYRTVSDYLREIVTKALPKDKPPKKAKADA